MKNNFTLNVQTDSKPNKERLTRIGLSMGGTVKKFVSVHSRYEEDGLTVGVQGTGDWSGFDDLIFLTVSNLYRVLPKEGYTHQESSVIIRNILDYHYPYGKGVEKEGNIPELTN